MSGEGDLSAYLRPTWFIDSDSPEVREFSRNAVGSAATPEEKAKLLFYAVRDGINYDPYRIEFTPEAFRASTILKKGFGYCVAKAIVLTAASRAVGVPSRLRFADVRNHLTTERLRRLMKTDLFIFHGYSEFYLQNRWVKATPTFNLSLCERFKVKPLDFDGVNDAVFHPFDAEGRRHMEYVNDHGSFADVPYERIVEMFRLHYGAYFEVKKETEAGAFEREAVLERP
ncbi:MAG TPA: transglutaminase family protein [Syntrophales bacterium]|nr:transglutaminase family protein [Syntrophales bacterium]HRS87980.1 transglutaminase family protein [Syntrophales bacterium]